ncbi:MAG: hypothetical protein RLO52_29275 [Sandaracinaceae bacterium]
MIKQAIGTMAMMAVLGVSSAAAQEREATVDAEVRGEPAEAPARTVAPVSTTVVVQAPARPEDAPPEAAPEDHARVRFHAALAGGGFFGDVVGGMGGLSVGLGVQFNQWVGLYYQAHGMLAALIEGGQDAVLAAIMYNSVIVDVTLGHVFQIGAGPSLDFLAGCAAGGSGAGCGDAGPFFGIDARVALALGGHDVGTRGGFLISADLHPTFYPNGVSLALVLGVGGQVY